MVQTNLIKGKMAELNYSQNNIAKEMGLSRVTISHKINNKQEFTLSEYIILCLMLKVPFEFFLK